MRVLVTGGAGRVGRRAVARLVRGGHDVVVIGRRPDIAIDGAAYRACDINDFDALREQIRGLDAVVHLAAIPNPSNGPGHEIFRINCAGTFNVYEAAAQAGVKRMVSASSINAFGFNFGIKPFPLRYFPIDEAHPGVTTDPYSFSKQVLEETAAYFWRRDGISSLCLRLPGVYDLDAGAESRVARMISLARQSYGDLVNLPEAAQQARVQRVFSIIETVRAERKTERPGGMDGLNPEDRSLLYGVKNFWTSIHAEDSAQAIEKGLLASYEGSHPIYVNDSENAIGLDSEILATLFYPEVVDRKRALKGPESLISIDRARELIGFEPEHSVSRWYPTIDPKP